MYSRQEILDEEVDRLELTVRTGIALRQRFGEHILVRELAMMNEEQILAELLIHHKNAKTFVNDINAALAKYGWALGTSWSDMPPSRHTTVRNPQQMCVRRDKETSIRLREPKGGGVLVSVVVTLEGDRARLMLPETRCNDMGEALELAQDALSKTTEQILALPYTII